MVKVNSSHLIAMSVRLQRLIESLRQAALSGGGAPKYVHRIADDAQQERMLLHEWLNQLIDKETK